MRIIRYKGRGSRGEGRGTRCKVRGARGCRGERGIRVFRVFRVFKVFRGFFWGGDFLRAIVEDMGG